MKELQLKRLDDQELQIEVYNGQILNRVKASEKGKEESGELMKVLVSKCIKPDGCIDESEITYEQITIDSDSKRIVGEGDIVMKLTAPYDAALVTSEYAGSIVPSVCAIIKNNGLLDRHYLLAALNSEYCKKQLRKIVSGSTLTIVSAGKLAGITIPIPDAYEQHRIGEEYRKTQEQLKLLRQIETLSLKRNDLVFNELVKDNDK